MLACFFELVKLSKKCIHTTAKRSRISEHFELIGGAFKNTTLFFKANKTARAGA